MATTLSKAEITDYFMGCIHCSQVIAGQWADRIDVDKEQFMRMTGPLGGGCFHGDICGCVSAALLVLGVACGHCEKGDVLGNNSMIGKITEFKQRFIEKKGSLICCELTGYDFSVPKELEKALADGVLLDQCPSNVNTALEILDEMLAEY